MNKKFAQDLNAMLAQQKINLQGLPLTRDQIVYLAQTLTTNFQLASSLTEIDLSYTGITALPVFIFRDCDAVKRINLESNKLRSLPLLPDRPYALQSFVASNNPLQSMDEKYFENCISLKTVYLDNTQLAKAPAFADSISLAWLHLNANPIKNFPDNYFENLEWLDTVFINDTKLKKLPNLAPCLRLHEAWVDDIEIIPQHIVPTAHIIKS